MATLEEARQVLSAPGLSGGPSLYDHLSEVLLRVLTDRPSDAAEAFEHLSAKARASHVGEPQFRSATEDPTVAAAAAAAPSHGAAVLGPAASAARAARLKWAAGAHALLRRGNNAGEGAEEEEDEDTGSGVTVPDLMDEAGLWEWAGVSLGRLETYRLCLSLKALARSLPAAHGSLRFWGRISTRGSGSGSGATSCYLLAEARATEDTLGDLDPLQVEGVDGANRFSYWASADDGKTWQLLPPVTARQIVCARQIRRYLTGDLSAAVPGYPPFPGREAELLRAQVARIASATSVSPAGFFEMDEEMEPPAAKPASAEAVAESFPRAPGTLAVADAWCHHMLEINARGRCRPPPPPPGADEDAAEAADTDAPPEVPPLRALSEDTIAEGSSTSTSSSCWAFRVSPGGTGRSAASAVLARSLVWPGACAVACGRRFTNVYIGDGVKYLPAPYQPPPPPAVASEWTPKEEEGEIPLLEAEDILVDPNPPAEEGADGDE